MKQLLLLAACTLVATTMPIILASPASANPALVAFCKEIVLPDIPQANLGECVSYVLASEKGFPAHDCDAFLEIAPDDFYLIFDSYADCVRTARQN